MYRCYSSPWTTHRPFDPQHGAVVQQVWRHYLNAVRHAAAVHRTPTSLSLPVLLIRPGRCRWVLYGGFANLEKDAEASCKAGLFVMKARSSRSHRTTSTYASLTPTFNCGQCRDADQIRCTGCGPQSANMQLPPADLLDNAPGRLSSVCH